MEYSPRDEMGARKMSSRLRGRAESVGFSFPFLPSALSRTAVKNDRRYMGDVKISVGRYLSQKLLLA